MSRSFSKNLSESTGELEVNTLRILENSSEISENCEVPSLSSQNGYEMLRSAFVRGVSGIAKFGLDDWDPRPHTVHTITSDCRR